MSRIALTSRDMAMKKARRQYVPVASTLAAASLSLLPIVANAPISPDWGFIVLLCWRLLRPEMWPATIGLPLGFFNDLVSGHPIGQSMALWTATLLILDMVDSRAMYRDYWMDWLLAVVLMLAYIAGGWAIAGMMGSKVEFAMLWPQVAFSVLAYPLVARLVVGLDRWRLSR
jgi:rod shape-determining protein MreD